MSKIALSGNASGTGTLTIAAPNTSTDRTLTLPDQTGTLLTGSGAIGVNASAATNSLVIDASGNVGIGTSSPATRLDVNVSGANGINLVTASSVDSPRLFFTGSGGGGTACVINNADGSLRFGTGATAGASSGTERARIDSSGNLLVGTTTVASTAGRAIILSTGAANETFVAINHDASASNGGYFMGFRYNGTFIGNIAQNGTTATSYNTSSDYRLKNTIAPMAGALAKLALLKPCTYKWNADGSDGEGFIAHELAEVCPGAVTGEKDAVDAEGNPQYQGIDTSFLVATLTAAIQELKAIVDAQGAEIAALKGQP